MTDKQTCPECSGRGEYAAFWDGYDPVTGKRTGSFGTFKCRLCAGSGSVDYDTAKAKAEGKQRRDDRVAAGRSIKEEADRLGISLVELSNIEHGRRPR